MPTFDVVEDSVMEPALQAAHPEIRTYAGARRRRHARIRLDVTPFGFHALVASPAARLVRRPGDDRNVGETRLLSYPGGAVPARRPEPFVERDLVQQAAQAVAPTRRRSSATPGGVVTRAPIGSPS